MTTLTPEQAALIKRLYGLVQWGYMCLADGGFIADDTPFAAATLIEAQAAEIAARDRQTAGMSFCRSKEIAAPLVEALEAIVHLRIANDFKCHNGPTVAEYAKSALAQFRGDVG